MASNFEKVYERLFSTIPLPHARIDGRRILVTGGSSGLGFEAAKHFSRQGATVLLGCRSLEKARAAKATIDALGGVGQGDVEIAQLDMASFASVREFAANVGVLDGAVLNAGIANEDWMVSADGWEMTLQVNVLSTTLLGVLLLQKMAAQAGKKKEVFGGGAGVSVPTISIVASEMYAFADFDALAAAAEGNIIRTLNDEAKFEFGESDCMTPRRYSMSKLLDIYIARELAARSPKSPSGTPLVVVNSVTPGFCHSNLLRDCNQFMYMLGVAKFIFARSTEKGARTYFHALVDAGVESHGEFLESCKIHRMPEKLFTSEVGRKVQESVWRDVMQVLEEVAPEAKKLE